MGVQRVIITAADEAYAPPDKEIEVSVGSGRVYITVYDGSDENKPSTKKKEYEVPSLWLSDLVNALAAFDESRIQLRALAVPYGLAVEAAEKNR